MGRFLIVDDDDDVRQSVADSLLDHGHEAVACSSARDAVWAIDERAFDAVITDVRMPAVDGLALCEHLAANHPDVPVILMTAYGDLPTVVGGIRAAAFDLLRKPFSVSALLAASDAALARRRSLRRVVRVEPSGAPPRVGELVGSSVCMQRLRECIGRFATSAATTLVTGESGTGKELVARALHRLSGRAGPFLAVNCAAIPREILESELFGHVRGAFTGAVEARPGLFLEADQGTLFLDEVGAMPLDLQPALLRSLEERAVRPVGGTRARLFDARIVAATNQPLPERVRAGTFREDLMFRLSALNIVVPPLREHVTDVVDLASHFLPRLAAEARIETPRLAPSALEALLGHSWPGNVRELENCLRAAITFATGPSITLADLPESMRHRGGPTRPAESGEHSLEEVERRHIERVLDAVAGNKAEAARRLGIDRTTLHRKLKRLGLDRSQSG